MLDSISILSVCVSLCNKQFIRFNFIEIELHAGETEAFKEDRKIIHKGRNYDKWGGISLVKKGANIFDSLRYEPIRAFCLTRVSPLQYSIIGCNGKITFYRNEIGFSKWNRVIYFRVCSP